MEVFIESFLQGTFYWEMVFRSNNSGCVLNSSLLSFIYLFIYLFSILLLNIEWNTSELSGIGETG